MEVVLLIGRILFAAIFIGGGIAGHLMDTESTAGYASSRGVPNAPLYVRLSGVAIAAGGLGVIFGVAMDLAALGLAAYCLIAAFMIHHFWTDGDDPAVQTVEMSMFMKNLSMAGGGLVIFVLAGAGVDMGWTLGSPVFDFTL